MAQTYSQKISVYTTKHPSEFVKSRLNQLWCKLCNKEVNVDRKSSVDNHRKSDKHVTNMTSSKTPQSALITVSKNHFLKDLTGVFLSENIPAHKLRSDAFKNLFIKHELPILTQSNAQVIMKEIITEKLLVLTNLIANKLIFLIIDESAYKNNKYINILVDLLENPNKTYLLNCIVVKDSVNATTIIHLIDDVIKKNNIRRENFNLLLSDAASYLILANRTLKILYPQMVHITCLSHLLHNCALKIRQEYKQIDKLISSIKMATVKHKDRREDFDAIGAVPSPIITRWGSWLRAADYYTKNLPCVTTIVNSWTGNEY